MVKEETWSVSIQRARTFFREQEDVTEEGMNHFVYGTCHIALTELKPKGMGVWAAKRICVRMEGEPEDVNTFITVILFSFSQQEVKRPLPADIACPVRQDSILP